MGEVYRAHDARLDREVAIKVLPDALASDPERIARFRREARVAASLNHPNIAAIYGFEDEDGAHFLVMELVEGPRSPSACGPGPMPIDEALAVVEQIAEGLEAAHESGDRPPGPQALQRQDHAGREGEDPRLRAREGSSTTSRRRWTSSAPLDDHRRTDASPAWSSARSRT